MRLEHVGDDGTRYVYDENIWTGRKSLSVNGVLASKTGKKQFSVSVGDKLQMITVKGSFLTGITLQCFGEKDEVICRNKWYEWILIFLPFLGFALGVFCGAIGGGLSALFGVLGAFINALILRSHFSIVLRVLLSIVVAVVAFFAWFGIYLLIVGGLAAAFPNLFG